MMADQASSEREEVRAQMDQTRERISSRIDALKDESAFSGRRVKDQALAWKGHLTEHAATLAGGATGLGLILALLTRRGRSDVDPRRVQQHVLTDEYVDRLARVVAQRLKAGQDLREALDVTLRERAPLLLRRPGRSSGVVPWGWLLGIGLVAGVGAGLNYAVGVLLGKDLVTLLKEQMGRGREGSTAEDERPDVHGTAGAEMPEPEGDGRR